LKEPVFFSMKKHSCLVIGDEHGRGTWKLLVDKYYHTGEVDTVVMLGDYTDSHFISSNHIKQNLIEIIDFKKSNPDNVHLLIGNHDSQYWFYPDFRCSGFRPEIAVELQDMLYQNRNLFDLAVYLDSTLLSHAGITTSWFYEFKRLMEKYSIKVPHRQLATILNQCLHEGSNTVLQHIGVAGFGRGGTAPTGGPLWADFDKELVNDYFPSIDQIVGHSYRRDEVPVTKRMPVGEILQCIDIGEGQLNYPTIVDYDKLIK